MLGFLAAGLLLGPLGAGAVTVGGTYNFTTGAGMTLGAPTNPVTGSFTISFDNSASITDSTLGFTLNSINILTGAAGYTYDQTNDRLFVGGLLNTVQTAPLAAGNVTDWRLRIDSFSSAPVFFLFQYTQAGTAGRWGTETGSLAKVPEPGSLALLGLGLMGLGLTRRKSA